MNRSPQTTTDISAHLLALTDSSTPAKPGVWLLRNTWKPIDRPVSLRL
jgi:hypothetical protein